MLLNTNLLYMGLQPFRSHEIPSLSRNQLGLGAVVKRGDASALVNLTTGLKSTDFVTMRAICGDMTRVSGDW